MNVAIVATQMSFHSSFNRNNIDLLINLGHKIHLFGNSIDTGKNGTHEDDFVLFCNKKNVELHFVDIPRNPFRSVRILESYFKMVRIMRLYEINFVHSHTPVGGLLGRICSKTLSIPNIYTAHGFHFFKGAPILNWLIYFPVEKILSRFTDAIVTINLEDFEFSMKFFKTKTYFIYGVGFDYSSFYFSPNFKKDNVVHLLSVGEINKNKNHKIVIESIANSSSEIHYTIAGEGKLKNKLSQMSAKRGLSKKVSFLGFISNSEIPFNKADIFVMPSKREGLPVSMLEAMASGLPVVGSNIRGIRDLIDEGKGGFLFNPRNKYELKSILEKLISNPQLRLNMGRYNQIKAISYDKLIVNDKMEKIYKEHII